MPEGSSTGARLAPQAPGRLAERLLSPPERIALQDVPSRWTRAAVQVTCRPGGVETGQALPGRIRGAWGRRLMAAASPAALANGPCDWEPPCAYDPLFREQGRITGKLSLPKPYTIAADAVDDGLVVTLTLFGMATHWLDEAAAALLAALREGVAAGDGSTPRVPIDPIRRDVRWLHTVALPSAATRVRLNFSSPLALRSGKSLRGDARSVLTSTANRVSGLARWQGCAVEADWSALSKAAARLSIDDSQLKPISWQRSSARQKGRSIPVTGLLGPLTIAGDLTPFLPLLALGATCHVGSHLAIGLGRYDLEVLE